MIPRSTLTRPTHRPGAVSARLAAAAGLAIVATALLLAGPPSASAAVPAEPGWQVYGFAAPTNLPPGGEGLIYLEGYNSGAGFGSSGEVVDTLPPELEAIESPGGPCTGLHVVTCTGVPLPEPTFDESNAFTIPVRVSEHAEAEVLLEPAINEATVSGGGASTAASTSFPVHFGAAPGPAGFGNADVWASRADGTTDTQAGSHPYDLTVAFAVNRRPGAGPGLEVDADGAIRGLEVNLPPGVIGNPTAIPYCPRSKFAGGEIAESSGVGCPEDTRIGLDLARISGTSVRIPVYNLAPPKGVAAEFGFTVASINTLVDARVRSDGDYGISEHINPITERDVLVNSTTIWGVPAEHGTGAPDVPFLSLPTSCQGPQPFSFEELGTWTDPTVRPSITLPSHEADGTPAAFDGCNQLEFHPTIEGRPTTDVADSPTGFNFDLHIPQNEDPEGLATAELKSATVTLPEGLVVDPSSANGLEGCTPAQIGLTTAVGTTPAHFTGEPAACPEGSKIGSVEVDTPDVDHPLPGAVYLASQERNPFGSLLAIYITVADPQTGIVVKLPGLVHADPTTGRLTATVAESPQLPFEDFHLDFFNGPHASLKTPSVCGTYSTTADLTPWTSPEGADAHPADSFATGQAAAGGGACPTSEAAQPDKPAFNAGTLSTTAGAYSPLTFKVSREDGSQRLSKIETTLPPGLVGKLAGIPYCPDASIAQAEHRTAPGQGALENSHPSCPAASEVGTVNVGAGAGPEPVYVSGHAYLAGPYKGAPLSLEIITPALAGPFDLGSVAVRTALHVNEETAQITAVSDPLPSILHGIPLDIRSVAVRMERPDFTLNPTSCDPFTVSGATTSLVGQSTALSSPFQVGECERLGFKPGLKLSLKGATKRSKNPALKAVLTYPSKGAYANIAKAQVTLPHSEFLDQSHIKTVCTRVQFAAGGGHGEQCPPGSIYGHARAVSPLLEKPLEGPVYLRSSTNKLPDLVAALGGQIDVALDGKIDTGKGGGIRNTFLAVPDAPVSRFVLEMQGGKKGLLVNSENICAKPQRATAAFTAQNGKVSDSEPLIANSCGGKGKKKHHGGGR